MKILIAAAMLFVVLPLFAESSDQVVMLSSGAVSDSAIPYTKGSLVALNESVVEEMPTDKEKRVDIWNQSEDKNLILYFVNKGKEKRVIKIPPTMIFSVSYRGYDGVTLVTRTKGFLGLKTTWKSGHVRFKGGNWGWIFDGKRMVKTPDKSSFPKPPKRKNS